MTGWALFSAAIGYVFVALATAWAFVRGDLERVARAELKIRRERARYVNPRDAEEVERRVSAGGSLITQRDRDESARLGFMVGTAWPVFLLLAGVVALIVLVVGSFTMVVRKLTKDVVPSAERDRLAAVTARRERQELEFLRNQARDLGLPFPGDDA